MNGVDKDIEECITDYHFDETWKCYKSLQFEKNTIFRSGVGTSTEIVAHQLIIYSWR